MIDPMSRGGTRPARTAPDPPGRIARVSAKNKVLVVVLILLAIVAEFVVLAFLMPANEQNSGIRPLEPDAMHQPSTN